GQRDEQQTPVGELAWLSGPHTASRLGAHDRAGAVRLDAGGDDLGARRRVLVDEHDQRLVQTEELARVRVDGGALSITTDLVEERAARHEETRDVHRDGELSTRIVAQVEDPARRTLRRKTARGGADFIG